MDHMMEKIVAYEDFLSDTEKMMEKAERLGSLIIIKDNKPAFQIYSANQSGSNKEENLLSTKDLEEVKDNKDTTIEKMFSGLTLKQAVLEVLMKADSKEMHVSEIAEEIYSRKLYRKRDGSKAHYTQIRAMCGQYPEEFETLPRNRVKLRA